MTLDAFLSRLDGVRRYGDKAMARCPAHDDREASLSVKKSHDGRVLLHCHAGCSVERVVAALELTMRDLMPDNGPDSARGRRGRGSYRPKNSATVQPPNCGCRLADYARTKRLPEDFLRELGLTDVFIGGLPAVRIPYLTADGTEAAVRFRIGLDPGGDRFRWRSGSKPLLYGLHRLTAASRRPVGEVVLVEGESDTQTLMFHGFRALGLPGASIWREDRDAAILDSFKTIYIPVEKDAGGEAMLQWISCSRIRDRVRLVDLGEVKDVSTLYLSDLKSFIKRFEEAMARAVPFAQKKQREQTAAHEADGAMCQELASSPAILDRLVATLRRLGVVGEQRLAKLIFLALVSRHFDRPVSCAVKGPSGAGKSFVAEVVLLFFDKGSFYVFTAMSERLLAYDEEPLSHRFIVIVEAAGIGEIGSYLIRSLLSEGRIHYGTVERTPEGLRPRRIEREGPTGLLVTTTALKLHPENETRLLSLPVDDSSEQTREILQALAERGGAIALDDASAWHAFDRWLSDSPAVVVPFAHRLAEKVVPVAVRLRRDFSAVLNLIRAHALLHQLNRPRDGDGRIVATIEDYRVVRGLVADLIACGVESTVPTTVRQTVEAVERLAPRGSDAELTLAQIARELKLDKTAVSRRVAHGVTLGYLANREDRKGRPARIVVGEPMPADLEILPDPSELEEAPGPGDRCTVAGVSEGGDPPFLPPPLNPEADAEPGSQLAEPPVSSAFSIVSSVDMEVIARWADTFGAGEVGLTAYNRSDAQTPTPAPSRVPELVNRCDRCLGWRQARLVHLQGGARIHLCEECRRTL